MKLSRASRTRAALCNRSGCCFSAVDEAVTLVFSISTLSAESKTRTIAAFMRAHGMAAQARMNPAQYAKYVLKNDRLAQEMTEAANPAMIRRTTFLALSSCFARAL